MHLSAAGRPALQILLPGPGHCQRIRRYLIGNGAAGGDIGAFAHRDRCNEIGVAADECPVANGAAVLFEPIIIGGNGSAAEVDAAAHVGIAHIGQVRHLGAFSQHAVFQLHKRADMALGTARLCADAL